MRVVTESPQRVATVTGGVTSVPREETGGPGKTELLFPTPGGITVDADFEGPILFEYLGDGEFASPTASFLDRQANHGDPGDIVGNAWAAIYAASPDGKWIIGHGKGTANSDLDIYQRRSDGISSRSSGRTINLGGEGFELALDAAGVYFPQNPGFAKGALSEAMTTTPDGLTWIAAAWADQSKIVIYRCEPRQFPEQYAVLDVPAEAADPAHTWAEGLYSFSWHPDQTVAGRPPLLAVGLGGLAAGAAPIPALIWVVQPVRNGFTTRVIVPFGDAAVQATYPNIQFRCYTLAWSPFGNRLAAFVQMEDPFNDFPAVGGFGGLYLSQTTFWLWNGVTLVNNDNSTAGYLINDPNGVLRFPTGWAWSKGDEIGYYQWCLTNGGTRQSLIGVGNNNWGWAVGGSGTFQLYIRSWEFLDDVVPFNNHIDHQATWLSVHSNAAIEPLADNEVLIASGDQGTGAPTTYQFYTYRCVDDDGQLEFVGTSATLHDAMVTHVAAGGEGVDFFEDEGLVVLRSASSAPAPRPTTRIVGQQQRVVR